MKKQSKSLDKLMQNIQALQESGDGKLSGGFEVISVAETMQLKAGADITTGGAVVATGKNTNNAAFCSCKGTGDNTNTSFACSCSSNSVTLQLNDAYSCSIALTPIDQITDGL
jgi:hypothetical protein